MKFVIVALALALTSPTFAQDAQPEGELYSTPIEEMSEQDMLQLLNQMLERGVSTEADFLSRCGDDQKTCRIGGSTWCCHRSKRCNYDPPGCDG